MYGTIEGPASSNLRRGGMCFRGEPANICTSRKEFFLNRVIPIWNDLPQEVRGAKSLIKKSLQGWVGQNEIIYGLKYSLLFSF